MKKYINTTITILSLLAGIALIGAGLLYLNPFAGLLGACLLAVAFAEPDEVKEGQVE